VFPGQGTQAVGMGVPWQHHPAWKILDEAERALDEPVQTLVLDAPAELRRAVDPWGPLTAEPLMRRIKARFDPHDILNPGLLLT